MSDITVRPIRAGDRSWAKNFLIERWGSDRMVAHGAIYYPAELEGFLHALPPQMQQSAMSDRKEFIKRYAFMRKLTEMAEKDKLDEKSPYKESLAVDRMNILTQAQLNEMYLKLMVEPADIQKFYDNNRDSYSQVKVKAIYVGFTSNPAAKAGASGKKYLDEAEAKAKADRKVRLSVS